MAEQQAATPPEAAPEVPVVEKSFDEKILEKFGLGEDEPQAEEHSETPSEESPAEGEEAEPEVEEFHWELKHNGELREVKSKDELTRLAQMGFDYDFKMQRFQEDQRKFGTMLQAAQARAALQAQATDALAEAKSYERQLKDYANIDWARAAQADPNAAFQARMAYDQLMNGYQAAIQKAQQLQQPIQQAEQAIDQTMVAMENQKLLERIPEWRDPARKEKEASAILDTTMKTYGVTEQELNSPAVQQMLHSHKFVQILRDAARYRDAMNTKGKKGPPQGQPRAAKPGVTQSPRSNSQRMGDIKRGLHQVQDHRVRNRLEEALIAEKFGLKD